MARYLNALHQVMTRKAGVLCRFQMSSRVQPLIKLYYAHSVEHMENNAPAHLAQQGG